MIMRIYGSVKRAAALHINGGGTLTRAVPDVNAFLLAAERRLLATVIGRGMPYARKPGRRMMKLRSGPRPQSAHTRGLHGRARAFFLGIRGPVPVRRCQPKDAEITGEAFSRRDLPSITDYHVPHLVTERSSSRLPNPDPQGPGERSVQVRPTVTTEGSLSNANFE
jgi:hypothetical protein